MSISNEEYNNKNIVIEEHVYKTTHQVGENNVKIIGMDLHNPVFFFSLLFISLFVTLILIFPDSAKPVFDAAKSWSIDHFDWLFMISGNFFVIFLFNFSCVAFWQNSIRRH